MPKTARLVSALIVLATLVACGLWAWNFLLYPGPTFQGRSARYWMNYDYRPPRADLEFQEAWKSLGSNSIPFLVESLNTTDPPLPHFSYRSVWSSLPPRLRATAPQPSPPAQVVRSRAASALGIIGEAAKPAIPALLHVMKSDESDFVRDVAREAIQKIDPGFAAKAGVK